MTNYGLAQAGAFICWTDTFTRTTSFGLGSDYTWQDWDSQNSDETLSQFSIDGSKVIADPTDTFESYLINRTIPGDVGVASFDFTTGADFDDTYFAYIFIVFEDDGSYDNGHQAFGIETNGTNWWLSAWWAGQFTGDDILLDPLEFNTTYRVKATYKDGSLNAKIWKVSDPEPDYMLFGETIGFVPFNRAWLDLEFSSGIASLDNLTFCIGPGPATIIQNYGQALASITNTTPPAQANADIKQTYNEVAQAQAVLNRSWGTAQSSAQIKAIDYPGGKGQAKALIETLPFIDDFNRTVADGMGDPYLWPGFNWITGPVQNQFANPPYVNVNGNELVIEYHNSTSYFDYANIHTDAYFIPLKYLPEKGFISYDFNTGTAPAGRYDFVPFFSIAGYAKYGTQFISVDISVRWWESNNSWAIGSFQTGQGQGTPTLSDNTWYNLTFRWDGRAGGSPRWTLKNRATDVVVATGSWGTSWSFFAGSASNQTAFPLVNISVNGNVTTDDFLIDNIQIGNLYPSAQAQARIKAFPKQFAQAQAYIGHFKVGQAQARIKQTYNGYGQAQARIADPNAASEFQVYAQATTYIGPYHDWGFGQSRAFMNLHIKPAQAMAQITTTWRMGQAQAQINMTWRFGQAQAIIGRTFGLAQARAVIPSVSRFRGQAQAYIKIKRWTWGQAQGYIKGRFGFAQAKALILPPTSRGYGQSRAQIKIEGNTRGYAQVQALISFWIRNGQSQSRIKQIYAGLSQAQAYINGSKLRPTQAQAFISDHKFRVAQARALIVPARWISGQANAAIKEITLSFAQAQAQIVGYTVRAGNSQAFIKRTIEQGNAQAFIEQTRAGSLVKYNGIVLPGYLQEENIENNMRMNITGTIYGETYSEYIGLENKILSLRMKVVADTYAGAKEKVFLASTILRSNRADWTKLAVINPSVYYLAKTQSISTQQTAGKNERFIDYEVKFECLPWKYGEIYSLTGTTLIDTNDVSRNLGNGTWTPAIIIATGNNITISGYTDSGEFTGFIGLSGAVNNITIDSETYAVTMGGENRSDLLTTMDNKLLVAPGRTKFAITGATSCEIIYQDRWAL